MAKREKDEAKEAEVLRAYEVCAMRLARCAPGHDIERREAMAALVGATRKMTTVFGNIEAERRMMMMSVAAIKAVTEGKAGV